MNSRALRSAAPAILLATLILVPFINKAFTIDDTVFLFEARHALTDPIHPTAFDMMWDLEFGRLSRIVPTGPIMAWLLIPSILADGAEWVAHAVQLAMLYVAIFSTVSLALRFGLTSAWATASGLILVAMPAVLGMAGTAMPDVPAMALGVAGIERLIVWRENHRLHQGIIAAILLGLAPQARSHLILLFVVAGLLLVGNVFSRASWKQGPWTRWVPFVGAVFITAVVSGLTHDPEPGGGSIVEAAVKLISLPHVATNTFAFAVHWVLAMAFAVPWLVLRWRVILRRYWLLLAASGAAASLLFFTHPDDAPYQLAPVAGLGVACLFDVLVDAFKRRDSLQLMLGLWLLLPLPIIIYVHLPPKYLLPSAPAASLLIAQAASRNPRLARPVLALTIVAGVLLGSAILLADAALSNVGRVAAQTLIAPNVAAGHRVWHIGHWGFQWYAEKAGAINISTAPPYPVPGDLIASKLIDAIPKDGNVTEILTRLGRVEDRRPGGRVMSREAGAGFYSNAWGYLPWAWGTDVIDSVDLWEIKPHP